MCSTSDESGMSSGDVFVPLWLIILLWIILWPLWIRRGYKLEEKRFPNPPQPHDP